MDDFEMQCETMIRKIFQCGRFDDPLNSLANTDFWSGLYSENFSRIHAFRAWSVLARLKNNYLDSVQGREDYYNQVNKMQKQLIETISNDEIFDIMEQVIAIVDNLNLSENPHISYRPTNDHHA